MPNAQLAGRTIVLQKVEMLAMAGDLIGSKRFNCHNRDMLMEVEMITR